MDTKIYKDYLGTKLTEEEIVACIASLIVEFKKLYQKKEGQP
jgi:hypothetical protein